MKLADQILVAMGEDLPLIKELGKIRAEVKKSSITRANLLNFYDTARNLMDKYPKNKKRIRKLRDEIAMKITSQK